MIATQELLCTPGAHPRLVSGASHSKLVEVEVEATTYLSRVWGSWSPGSLGSSGRADGSQHMGPYVVSIRVPSHCSPDCQGDSAHGSRACTCFGVVRCVLSVCPLCLLLIPVLVVLASRSCVKPLLVHRGADFGRPSTGSMVASLLRECRSLNDYGRSLVDTPWSPLPSLLFAV